MTLNQALSLSPVFPRDLASRSTRRSASLHAGDTQQQPKGTVDAGLYGLERCLERKTIICIVSCSASTIGDQAKDFERWNTVRAPTRIVIDQPRKHLDANPSNR